MHPDGSSSSFVSAQDGLRLHVREWGSRVASALPVVCLPGLARTAADFDPLAATLPDDPAKPRLAFGLPYRRHRQSEDDRNPANYRLPVAMHQRSAVLIAHEITPVII